RTGGPFIGNLQNAFFMNLDWDSGPTASSKNVPEFIFAIFQCMFAVITPALMIGAAAERGLDFAGGIPVHISSGAAGLAFCFVLGRRNQINRPHNLINVVIGTVLLWFGWFGFNGGSAVAADRRAIMACIVTNLAASFSGLTWMFMDFIKFRRLRAVSFCSGVVSGLVAITPASGYVAPYAAVVFGIASGILCNLASVMKTKLNVYDDAMDVFAIHGIGGFIGNVLTGIFADKDIVNRSSSDSITIKDGDTDMIEMGESAYCFAEEQPQANANGMN
ncbi:17523_t:CDS:2, partial [Racocetra fulgida]